MTEDRSHKRANVSIMRFTWANGHGFTFAVAETSVAHSANQSVSQSVSRLASVTNELIIWEMLRLRMENFLTLN